MSRALRLRLWFLVMDVAALGQGIPRSGWRRRVFFWAAGNAYEAEGIQR